MGGGGLRTPPTDAPPLPLAPRTLDQVPSGVAPPRALVEFESMQAKKDKGVVAPQVPEVEMEREGVAASHISTVEAAVGGQDEVMDVAEAADEWGCECHAIGNGRSCPKS